MKTGGKGYISKDKDTTENTSIADSSSKAFSDETALRTAKSHGQQRSSGRYQRGRGFCEEEFSMWGALKGRVAQFLVLTSNSQ
jgi:hypothetical protein